MIKLFNEGRGPIGDNNVLDVSIEVPLTGEAHLGAHVYRPLEFVHKAYGYVLH
jgi:hypothetical protein